MNELGESFGTAAEGSLFARALEPDTGAREPHPHQPADCANCGTPLVGAFCHACGQQAHLHRTIGAFMHELLHGALHFEGKMWRTLTMLALRPGALTRRYIEGARARFVSPMALFLFSVFVMFAVFQTTGITAPSDIATQATIPVQMHRNLTELEGERAELRARLDGLPRADARRAPLEDELADAEEAILRLRSARTLILNEASGSSVTFSELGIEPIDAIVRKWRENPGLMLYKLQANSYKFPWLLIPLSLPFVWLLFAWKRQFNGYDHAIFVTYSLSFMSLLFIALSVLGKAGVEIGWLFTAATTIAPVHLYRQLRGAYGLSRISAVWRLIALLLFIGIVALLFLQILIVLGGF